MFANYTGKRGRSLSTADVYRLGDDTHKDDDAVTPRRSFSALGRQQIRRPTTRPPPVPPKRSDSFSHTCVSTSDETTALTRVRSYLSDEIREKFESTAALRSPSSSNFVKKLVATLERRHKDSHSPVKNALPDAYRRASFREMSRQDRGVKADDDDDDGDTTAALDFSPRFSQLEEVHEADNEEDGDGESDSSNPDDYFSDMWPSSRDAGFPAICSYPSARTEPLEKAHDKPGNSRRSLRSVFSSLMSWRIGGKASLPKGSRHEYYATRESLGEELRAFRRDTMPRLMEHAALNNSRLSFGRKSSTSAGRRDTQDFAKLIRRADGHQQSLMRPPPSPRSLATIHPIYGGCKGPAHRLQEPAIAQQQQQPTTTSNVVSDEHLLRPSRLRVLQKRLSREIDALAAVELRPASMHYDVPTSNPRPVVVQEYDQPEYENVGLCSQDKRLSCTLFTTF